MNFKSLDLTLDATTDDVPDDDGVKWLTVRIKELPISTYAPNLDMAQTLLTSELADYMRVLDQQTVMCTHCQHPGANHWVTNSGVIKGCAGPLDGDEDDYCESGCEGFEAPGE